MIFNAFNQPAPNQYGQTKAEAANEPQASLLAYEQPYGHYGPGPVALGLEQPNLNAHRDPLKAFQSERAQLAALGAPPGQSSIIVSEGAGASGPENMLIQPSSIFNQPHGSAGGPNGEPQVLASFYIDQFGNQQVRVPNGVGQFGPQAGGSAFSAESSGVARKAASSKRLVRPSNELRAQTREKNFYNFNQPTGVSPTQTHGHSYAMGADQMAYNQLQDQLQAGGVNVQQPQQMLPLDPQHNQVGHSQEPGAAVGPLGAPFRGTVSDGVVGKDESSKSAKTLTNEQLLALIEELKEFNSQQVPRATEPEISTQQEEEDDDNDNDSDTSSIDLKHSPEEAELETTEPKRRVGQPVEEEKRRAEREHDNKAHNSNNNNRAQSKRKGKLQEKPNADDLAKFAKFLMTKEGANMRFQLGLEKDSPDDGDERDEQDSLLESKRKQRKAPMGQSRKEKELNELDNKHTQVSDHMDKLLEQLTGAFVEANKASSRKRAQNKLRANREPDSRDEDLRGRARRHSGASSSGPQGTEIQPAKTTRSTSSVQRERTTIEPSDASLANPKGLRVEKGHGDNFAKQLMKQELQLDQVEHSPEASSRGDENLRPDTNGAKSRRHVKGGRDEVDFDIAEGDEGEEAHQYSGPERKSDREALLKELNKTRGSRTKLRSYKPVRGNPVLQQALSGKMGVQTERRPDGSLTLTSGHTGGSVNLRLGDVKTKESPKGAHRAQRGREVQFDEPERLQSNSDVDQRAISRVEMQSGQPVKDEYPISEQVNKRINALSHNLDRYFNDGFLKEIEPRSGLQTSPKGKTDSPTTPASSAAQDDSKLTKDAKTAEESKGDRDFDVDVGIDGKRDEGPKSDDDYAEDEEGEEEGAEQKKQKKKEEKKKKQRESSPVGAASKVRQRKSVRNDRRGGRAKNEKQISKMYINSAGNEPVSGSVKQDMSAANEHLLFESGGGPSGQTKSTDPVDGETFDTPIGPDSWTRRGPLNNIPVSARKKLETSKESSKVATKFGKQSPNKFYEEPDW